MYKTNDVVRFRGELYNFVTYDITKDLCVIKKGGIQLSVSADSLERMNGNDHDAGFDWDAR